MNDVNFTLPFGEPGEAFVAPGDGPTGGYDLAQCQDSGAVTCGAPVDVVKDWDTLTTTGDTTVWCRADSGPGGWDFRPGCIDIGNPNWGSYWESHPLVADILKNIAIGSGVVACAVGTLGACAVGVALSATGASIVDASRACSTGRP